MTEPMTNARLAGIEAVIRKPRGPARDHTLAVAATDLVAEVRRLRSDQARILAIVADEYPGRDDQPGLAVRLFDAGFELPDNGDLEEA